MIYVGIDPGQSGGISALSEMGAVVLAVKMPATDRDVLDLLRCVANDPCSSSGIRAALEHVHAMPKQGVTSTFTFGRGFGALCMGLTAAEIPYDLVSSMKWMGAMQCRTGGDKSVSKRRAQQLFPQVKVTDYLADSLLIAEYLRRRERMVVS